jgi:hypothetical protein
MRIKARISKFKEEAGVLVLGSDSDDVVTAIM